MTRKFERLIFDIFKRELQAEGATASVAVSRDDSVLQMGKLFRVRSLVTLENHDGNFSTSRCLVDFVTGVALAEVFPQALRQRGGGIFGQHGKPTAFDLYFGNRGSLEVLVPSWRHWRSPVRADNGVSSVSAVRTRHRKVAKRHSAPFPRESAPGGQQEDRESRHRSADPPSGSPKDEHVDGDHEAKDRLFADQATAQFGEMTKVHKTERAPPDWATLYCSPTITSWCRKIKHQFVFAQNVVGLNLFA